MTPEQFAKLPKWAQAEFTRLLALRALRHAMELEMARALAAIDTRIALELETPT